MVKSKREEFIAEKTKPPLDVGIIIIAVSVALVLGSILYVNLSPRLGLSPREVQSPTTSTASSSMVDISAKVQGAFIQVPLASVKKNRLVYFEYRLPDRTLPLLAYVNPSQKVVTAVSVCEPCRSTRFHIEGAELVCNTCQTRWTLEGLRGISGGCTQYPPDAVQNTVKGKEILIDVDAVKNWRPRA